MEIFFEVLAWTSLDLHHFIMDVSMSVAELNNCRVMRSEPPVEELTQEMLQNAAEVIAKCC